MKIKFYSVFTLLLLCCKSHLAQVNLQQGSLSYSYPVFSFKDNLSRLSLNLGINYNSGNGLKLNQIASSVGTGWNLSGIPVISRIQKGLPDDQYEKSGTMYDTTKYPAGYIYNGNSISSGCPTAINKYPIFEYQNIWYLDNNTTEADRELDEFQFTLNDRTGSFIIDKNVNAVLLDNSRLKVDVFTALPSNNCRTTITKFEILDENGIKYEFAERELSKVYKIKEVSWPTNALFQYSYDVPLDQNPYVAIEWYVSKITDIKTGREILFEYNTEALRYEYKAGLHTEIFTACTAAPPACYSAGTVTITPVSGSPYDIRLLETHGVVQKSEILKKEIKKITLSDSKEILFDYNLDRKDFAGTHALTNITVTNYEDSRLIRYALTQSYFVKNEIKTPANSSEEKWSRLCLQSIQRFGNTDAISEKPFIFEYYIGTNATENFVPPHFFHASDPWGYYNGSYSGVTVSDFLSESDLDSWGKVCIYNQGHNYPGGQEIITNCKAGYAKNGLLKKVTNPFGGSTEYEYEQNYFDASYYMSYDWHSSLGAAVGGVHLSKIIQKNYGGAADRITEYSYSMSNGKSSLWGEEEPRYENIQKSFWQAEDQYFNGLNCNYHMKYLGRSQTSSHESFFDKVSPMQIFNYARFGSKLSHTFPQNRKATKRELEKRKALIRGFVRELIINYILGIVISCSTPAPQNLQTHTITNHERENDNLLPIQFKRVTESVYSSTGVQTGKTEYEFTSPDDFPLIVANNNAPYSDKPRAYPWMYGLQKSVKTYDNTPKLLKSVENEYTQIKQDVTDPNSASCNCESYYQQSLPVATWDNPATYNDFTTSNINVSGLRLKVDPYNIITGRAELKKTTEKLYNLTTSDAVTTVNEYSYSSNNHLISSAKTTDSKGTIIETKTYYPEDYNSSASSVLHSMVLDNFINAPVSTETWQTKGVATPEMLSSSVTEYGVAANGDYKPIKSYALESDAPVSQATIGAFNPNQLVRNNTLITPQSEISYNSLGNPVLTKDLQGLRNNSIIYSYGDMYPIAEIVNATPSEIAYTSFEAFDQSYVNNSNWSIQNADILTEQAPTGSKYCFIRSTPSQTSLTATVTINQAYKLSFWASASSFILNSGISPSVTGPNLNGWTYYEFDLPSGTAAPVITGNNCKIDELRLYPKKASMTTVTYDYGIGKTSECDMNNRITYYEYDGLGRVTKVLDEHHNIVRTYEYHYKN